MPTKEQMDAVEQKVEWLKSRRYARDASHPPTPMPDELIESLNNLRDDGKPPVSPSDLALPGWEDLSRGEQQAVLSVDVAWKGFSEAQRDDVINRVLDGQDAEFWMDGVADKRQPDSRKPRNHGTYQVWRDGKTHSLDVESVGVREVVELTDQPVSRWIDNPAVTALTDAQRPTRIGDVIVDPTCGAWEIKEDCYQVVEPPPPVAERMQREGIVPQHIELLRGWLDAMHDALSIEPDDPLTPEETKAIAAEIRADEYAARVRDYGETDAATYEQRMRKGASMPVTSLTSQPSPSDIARADLDPPGGPEPEPAKDVGRGRRR
jgi:hypothetical protein